MNLLETHPLIDKIDDCIDKLSSTQLSSILPKCEVIALELKDYDSWLFLRLHSSNILKQDNSDMEDAKNSFIKFCLDIEMTNEEIKKRYAKVFLLHTKSRTIEEDKIQTIPAYEIENFISQQTAHIETLNLPEGMAEIDVYYEHHTHRNAKVKLLDNLRDLNTYYGQIKKSVLSILVDLRQKATALSATLMNKPNHSQDIRRIFDRFHQVVKQLRSRHNDRSTLDVEDEYDVQDLLHSLLRLHFEDIRPEEWTPSYAGGSSRMDFLIKSEKVAIEVKRTRKGLNDRLLGEQLIVDVDKYKTHPDCEKLFCFVYDPEGLLGNPAGITNDLNAAHSGFVEVIIRP